MAAGIYQARKKNGTPYYRANITYQNKHISLGSYEDEKTGTLAYRQAQLLLSDYTITIDNINYQDYVLSHEKIITLLNFRDNKIYIKNPIYLLHSYFHYYLTPTDVYKFDNDDLFYYSEHKILRRGGHLFVNDYGMQVTILSRFGIRSFAIAGRDYRFANQDPYDFRYENLININPYHGVRRQNQNGILRYDTYIHINGDFHVGCYESLNEAAIAYNKAVDYAHKHGIHKNFPMNFLADLSARAYAEQYLKIPISDKYLAFLRKQDEKNT